MKAFKLFIIFLILLGAIIGVFFLIFQDEVIKLPPPTDDTYQTYRDQFEEDWKQKGDWDKDLYLSHCDMVNQLSTHFEAATLKDLSTKMASELVYIKIFDEWGKSNCNKATVDEYRAAVDVIKENDSNAKEDPNIIKILDVYSTYCSAYNLINKKLSWAPRFSDDDWPNFSTISGSVERERSSIIGNTNYKTYLANISYIKNGLNEIPDRLDNAKHNYYRLLAEKIIDEYSTISHHKRNREDLKKLQKLNSRFQKESNIKNNDLSRFVDHFEIDVKENEHSLRQKDQKKDRHKN